MLEISSVWILPLLMIGFALGAGAWALITRMVSDD